MALYTRRQLVLLLALLAASGIGLAVRHWRVAHPDVAARLERFDLESAHGDQGEAREERRDPGGKGDRGPAPRRPRIPKLAAAVAEGSGLDLNRATADDLARLPGVGPALAARIVAARETGAFDSVDDLVRVRGLGRGRIERLRPHVTVGHITIGSLLEPDARPRAESPRDGQPSAVSVSAPDVASTEEAMPEPHVLSTAESPLAQDVRTSVEYLPGPPAESAAGSPAGSSTEDE